MAKYGPNSVAFILVDGYNLLGYTVELSENVEAVIEDTTVFGDAWEGKTAVGLSNASLSQKAFYDDAAGASDVALVSQYGTSRIVCYGVEGNTLGKAFVGFAGAMEVSYKRVVSRGELHKIDVEYKGNGQVWSGDILATLAASTDTVDGTSVNNTASSASGGAGFLQVTAITLGGYTSITEKIQHSANDSAWADLITFTATTAANTSQYSTVSGTVNQYLRETRTLQGAGSGQSITRFVGFARG